MKPGKALIVDNEKIIVEMLSKILEQKGYEIDRAYGGLEALAKLKQTSYELVLLDLVMPRVGGDRICKYIKQSADHKGTKVIIVTAIAVEAQQRIAHMHPDACVAKGPFPQMKTNIEKALALLGEPVRPQSEMIIGREGLFSRQVVHELLFAQRHFEAILSSMSEGVIELDTNQVITYVNAAAQNIIGKKEWELIGKKFIEGTPPDLREETRALLEELSARPDSLHRDLTISMKGRVYSLSFRNVIRDKAVIGLTVVADDITEKKLLEEERAMRERLTGVVEMAGAAAHELNQPLAVISGYCQLLLRDAASLNEKVRDRAQLIFEQVERLGGLTKKFTNIVAYKTKAFGKSTKIVDIEKSSSSDNGVEIKGLWE